MSATSQKAIIREMTAEELQQYADELYSKCNCDILSISPQEHSDLKECAANYFDLTGEFLQPTTSPAFLLS